jgi:hypothetical protein
MGGWRGSPAEAEIIAGSTSNRKIFETRQLAGWRACLGARLDGYWI